MYVSFPKGGAGYSAITTTTNVDIAGLNGDQDGDYVMTGYFVLLNNQAITLTLQPNQLSTNQRALIQATVQAGAPSTSTVSNLMLESFSTDVAGTSFFFFQMRFTSLTGRIRRFYSEGYAFLGTTSNSTRMSIGRGWWSDTTTAITNLRINSSVASSILTGSFITLQKTGVNT